MPTKRTSSKVYTGIGLFNRSTPTVPPLLNLTRTLAGRVKATIKGHKAKGLLIFLRVRTSLIRFALWMILIISSDKWSVQFSSSWALWEFCSTSLGSMGTLRTFPTSVVAKKPTSCLPGLRIHESTSFGKWLDDGSTLIGIESCEALSTFFVSVLLRLNYVSAGIAISQKMSQSVLGLLELIWAGF